MIRNIKALGLAFVAVLAMSAVVASAAQAEATTHKFTTMDNTYPETIHGANTAGQETFSTEAGVVECASTFSGTSKNEASTTIRVHPVYTNCKAFGFLNATVNTTGCDYEFHLTTRVAVNQYQAHVAIVCEVGTNIVISSSGCIVDIGPQSLTTVDLTNNAATTDILVKPTVTNIHYTVTTDHFPCPFGSPGTKTGGTYTSHSETTITSTTAGTKGIHIG